MLSADCTHQLFMLLRIFIFNMIAYIHIQKKKNYFRPPIVSCYWRNYTVFLLFQRHFFHFGSQIFGVINTNIVYWCNFNNQTIYLHVSVRIFMCYFTIHCLFAIRFNLKSIWKKLQKQLFVWKYVIELCSTAKTTHFFYIVHCLTCKKHL